MASITSKGDGERVTSYANSIIHPAATPTATLLCMDPPRSLPTSFAPLRPPQRRSHHFLSRAFDSSRLQNVFKVAPLYTVPGNNIKNAFGFVRRVQIRGAGGTGATQATHPPPGLHRLLFASTCTPPCGHLPSRALISTSCELERCCVGQGEIFLLHAIITSCHLARLAIFAGNANALPGYRINNLNLTIYIIIFIIHWNILLQFSHTCKIMNSSI